MHPRPRRGVSRSAHPDVQRFAQFAAAAPRALAAPPNRGTVLTHPSRPLAGRAGSAVACCRRSPSTPAGPIDNGKPVARRGRKATGLSQVAGLPNRRWTMVVQKLPRARMALHAVTTLGMVVGVLLAAAADFHR